MTAHDTVEYDPPCSCGPASTGHPNPHAITCPMHAVVADETARLSAYEAALSEGRLSWSDLDESEDPS